MTTDCRPRGPPRSENPGGQIDDIFYARIGKIAAGDLARAFEQVADHHAAAEHRPFVQSPAEFEDQRREEDAGSATRPVMTTPAPAFSASTIGAAPM